MSQVQELEKKDPVGLPDFTLPVAIIAQLIAHLKVDIVAQSIENLRVDIAAQSVAELKVNVVAASATLNVNIVSSQAILNVNIVQSQATLNVNIVSSQTAFNVVITQSTVALDINIKSPLDTSGNVKINIAAQSITLNVNVTNSQLNVYVTNSSLNVYVTNSTLNVSITNTSLNVNVTNSSITIVFGSQTTGVKTEDIWSSEQGYNKVFRGAASVGAGAVYTLASYTVPSGKKLYIAFIVVSGNPPNATLDWWIYNETTYVTITEVVQNAATPINYSPPIVIPGGQTVSVKVYNPGTTTVYVYVSMLAWEK